MTERPTTDVPKMSRLREYALLMRMDKPIGSLLLLWPTLWALWIASEGMPEPLILAVFVTGVFVMRSAGCVVNDISTGMWNELKRAHSPPAP